MARGPALADPRLPRLAAITGLVQRHAVAALAANRAREATLAVEIAALQAEDGGTEPSAYERAGAGTRRARWCAARLAGLNAERARLRAECDGLARTAARAIARDQVVARMRDGGNAPR